MTTRAKLTLSAALATLLTALCLSPLFHEPMELIPQGLFMVAVAAAAGAGLRVLPLPRMLVVPLQLLAVLYVLMLGFVQSSMVYGLLPGPKALDALHALLTSGGQDIQDYAIPAPATAGLRLIVIGALTLVAVLVDALAVTYRRAAAAGLPLLALYSVGTGLAGTGGGAWLWFLFASFGYLVLLHTEGQDRLSRWGRVFRGSGRSSSGLSYGGYRVAIAALAAAVVLPAFVPNAGLGLFGGLGGGNGTAGSGGSGPGQDRSLNLVVALTANIRSNDDTELLRFTTDAGEADQLYLRVAALTDFNGTEWSLGNQTLEAVPTALPRPEGLGPDVASHTVRTTVQVSDKLSTTWLPMPYPVSWIEVGPTANWRFDRDTRALGAQAGQKTNSLNYAVGSYGIDPSPAQLRTSGAAPADFAKYVALPANLPPVVRETAEQITKGKNTAYDKAVALQSYFTGGGFTYSTKVDPRTGPDAIAQFLKDKDGFCVHFAATMAAMARTQGIPARVAIGFTPGTGDDRSRVIRSSNFHAWPELYFPGTGWLRFEPTPGRGTVPEYTREQTVPAPSASAAQPSAAPSDTAAPAPSDSSACTAAARRAGDCGVNTPAAELKTATTSWWLTWHGLTALSCLAVLLALLATPMLWRARLRRRRLGGRGRHHPDADRLRLTEEQVLAAWAELIDSAWDVGIPPDDARTPRYTVRRITETAGLDTEAAAAAGRVALATEQVLYARETPPQEQLAADVRAARQGLRSHAGRRQRIRAVLLPASAVQLWWRTSDRIGAVSEWTSRVLATARATVTRPFRRRRGGGD